MKKLLESENAVSAVVGMIIVLALTITSISVILLYAMPTLDDMQDMANAQGVEQAFTVFDSRTSKVALGESPSQTTSFSISDGSMEVNGGNDSYNDSRIVVICADTNATWFDDFETNMYTWEAWAPHLGKSGMSEFNASMGSITYTKDERIIGYEGGGIWSKYPTGNAIMISPPEFHYNGETVTLPIMTITGTETSSGTTDVDVTISSSNMPVVLYPDPAADPNRINPVEVDKVLIYIKSEFYDAWADYAETLVSTNIALDHANKTAIVELDTLPDMGTQTLDSNFRIVQLNESNAEPITDFAYYFEAISHDASNFNAVETYVTASSGTKYLEYEIKKNVIEHIKYTDSSVGTDEETWVSISGDSNSSFPINIDPSKKKEANSTFDLLSNTYLLEYNDHDGTEFSWNVTGSTTMPPDIVINDGDIQSLNNITQHYFKLMAEDGSVRCTWSQKKNTKLDVEGSSYTLTYDGGGAVITYLHVTRNDLTATLN
ncbi:hypothetical protein [Methanolobus vulcani]|uniref:DUF7308 domain-containing protein n=1 Tax=Methanolobus vulcani TaxID=38026 RepID=A0A7Z8P5E0_9EURY|nr:hypothetical protein [Methanolobus vulcani]TQD28246.1 hypothetical protein FKV42_00825 [Methanolobus vulcani]